jgi:hypothetical protein
MSSPRDTLVSTYSSKLPWPEMTTRLLVRFPTRGSIGPRKVTEEKLAVLVSSTALKPDPFAILLLVKLELLPRHSLPGSLSVMVIELVTTVAQRMACRGRAHIDVEMMVGAHTRRLARLRAQRIPCGGS